MGTSAAARVVTMGTNAASAEQEADDDSAAVVVDASRVPSSGGPTKYLNYDPWRYST